MEDNKINELNISNEYIHNTLLITFGKDMVQSYDVCVAVDELQRYQLTSNTKSLNNARFHITKALESEKITDPINYVITNETNPVIIQILETYRQIAMFVDKERKSQPVSTN